MRVLGDQRGFTLPELFALVVLSLSMFGICFAVLHTNDYSSQNRDSVRQLHLAFLAQTIRKYKMATGSLPPELPSKPTLIASENNDYDLCAILVPHYLSDLPLDPIAGLRVKAGQTTPSGESCDAQGTRYSTGYYISRDKLGRVVLSAAVSETRKSTVTLSL